MTMMKAAVVPKLGGRVEIRELPVPEPGPGQVLVRMVASGLCHTDIHEHLLHQPGRVTSM